jgi:formate hydrogenlyase subunit 6/NADH:ubiquinone oxidoreductase subunit I
MKTPGKMVCQVLASVFKKPATVNYPTVKVTMPENFRGKLKFDGAKCIGCKLCMRDCPAGAIVITKRTDGGFDAEIDLSKCIYCAQCVDSCPKAALAATTEFELASLTRGPLKVTFHGPAKPTQTPTGPANKPETDPAKKA